MRAVRAPETPAWLADATVGFAGRVVDELGRPLAGVVVMATHDWSGPITRTGDDGGFTLPVLPPGRYVLFAVRTTPPATSRPIVVETGYFPARLRLVVADDGALL
ncbi:MAG TPA: carboxypeptidase-like regulatory domain-containing protein [Kofleriaceae bacterium]